MKPWYLLAGLLGTLSEFVGFFYLFHVSLQDQQLWPQFGAGYLLYFCTSLLSTRFLLPLFLDFRKWTLLACACHSIVVPVFFTHWDFLVVPVLAMLGFFRLDSIATLALFSVVDERELRRRSLQLKIVYYVAQVGASMLVFLMWVYPPIATILASLPFMLLPLAGLLIYGCTREDVPLQVCLPQAAESDMAKRVYHMEMNVTCIYYALTTYMMVFFVHSDVMMLPLTNVVFATACIGLVAIGYRYVRKDNVNWWYILFIAVLVLAWIASSLAFVTDAALVHPACHLVVVLFFATIHIAPWNVLFDLEQGNHTLAMVEHRIIGQALGFLIGLGAYQAWGTSPYFLLAALCIYCVVTYEDEYLKPKMQEQ